MEDTRRAVLRLLSANLRDKAAFIYNNELYTTQKFISADKNEGLACMVASARKRGAAFDNVAWVHNRGASGGDAGTCTSGVEYSIPTTVIAKRSGYGNDAASLVLSTVTLHTQASAVYCSRTPRRRSRRVAGRGHVPEESISTPSV